jgi:hypothetical protein
MPTLEDTIEFQASTLNDLLEAEAKSVAVPSAGEGKYRSWAFLSTAAAGLLAILLVVSLVTDSGGGGGKSAGAATATKKTYEGSVVAVRVSQIPSDVAPDVFVNVSDKTGNIVLTAVPVTKIVPQGKDTYGGPSIEVTVPPAVSTAAFDKAFPTGKEIGKVKKADTTGATPPATTTPESTPPASTTPESTPPAQGTPPSSG